MSPPFRVLVASPDKDRAGKTTRWLANGEGKEIKMLKYVVSGMEFDTIDEAIEEFVSELDEDCFEDYLHDEYGYDVDICGEYFDPVEILREYTRGDYDDKYDEWLEEAKEEFEDSIRNMEADDSETLYGIEFECIEDEEEEDEEETPAPAPVSAPRHTVEDEAEFDAAEAMRLTGELAEMLAAIPSVYVDKDKLKRQLDDLTGRLECVIIGIHTIKERSS